MIERRLIPCHRLRSRSFVIRGRQFPICARCTGIFVGYFLLPLFLMFQPNTVSMLNVLLFVFLLSVPMLVDGFTQKWKWRESNNGLRLMTGVLFGAGQATLIGSVVNEIVRYFV
ncbi:DUF2085 domain-containing protein [Paenibacillus sp. 481]|uniref:DUF2085 domain-containing protein n=1 Tax=Paenibacillus sp. 481 TaxID=2835869 RepID=UPI001E2B7771|nr:DUF2085 domain-containing protein [Paenibacillus sp. 481]UHA72081.1 DUF2085 domain-containing protein [Paenibacillus sp. 481]